MPRWLIINAEHTRIGIAKLLVPNGFHLEATDIVGSAVIRRKTIRLFEAQGTVGETRMYAAIGVLRAADPFGLDVDHAHKLEPRRATRVGRRPARRKGNLASLAIVGHTTAPFRADFTGRALDLTNHWHWLGDAVVHDLDIRAWGGAGTLGIITGEFALHGNSAGVRRQRPPRIQRGCTSASFRRSSKATIPTMF